MELIEIVKLSLSARSNSDSAIFDIKGNKIWSCMKAESLIPETLSELDGFKPGGVCDGVYKHVGIHIKLTSYESEGKVSFYTAELTKNPCGIDLTEFFAHCRTSIFNAMNIARQFNYFFEENEMYEESILAGRQIKNCYSLLRQLVNFSEIKKYSDGDWEEEETDICAVTRTLLESVHRLINSTDKKLSYSVPDEPIAVKTDTDRFCHAFLNIVTNAFFYTLPDGEIKITLEKRGQSVLLTVKDNGTGVSAAELPKLCLCGYKSGTSDNGKMRSGFGLYIAKCFSQKSGGSLIISSKENEGTAVSLSIPVSEGAGPLSFRSESRIYKGGFSPVDIALCDVVGDNAFGS
ncbi:MAG: sensor histidine kinase [Oscillospiraceae bacterium]